MTMICFISFFMFLRWVIGSKNLLFLASLGLSPSFNHHFNHITIRCVESQVMPWTRMIGILLFVASILLILK